MPKILKPLQVYPYLPKTNCGRCGEVSCMAFAVKLIGREATVEQCPPLFEPENRERLESLTDLLMPSVKAVTIGVGERAVTIGGKDTMYRHELAFPNPTAIAIDVHDEMTEGEIIGRIRGIEGFVFSRIGQDLKLDLIAVRCVSGDPLKFAKAVTTIARNSTMPLILCSFDPGVMKGALEVVGDRKPLIYAATEQNWREIGALALRFGCPVVALAPNDVGTLKSLSRTLKGMGVDNIVLDPGSYVGGTTLSITIDNFTMIRRAAVGGDRDLGYPLIAVPETVWLTPEADTTKTKFRESFLACMFLVRYADLLVMHSTDIWALLPLLTLRQCIYTDPKKPVAVEPGLRKIGTPDEDSPVMLTSNFALTWTTVESDLLRAGVNCHLLVIDTGGLSVQTSVAGGQLNADKIAETIKATGIGQKVKHRKLIIPGFASRLKGEIEDLTGWEVLVGPKDSSQIPEFLKEHWERRTKNNLDRLQINGGTMEKTKLVVAIAGKGGAGKTTLAALMVKLLSESKRGSILAIDANPDSNLSNVLGVPVTQTVGMVANKLKKSMGKAEIAPETSKRDILEYHILDILKETPDFDILVMGRTEGEGCYCLVNDLLTDIIDNISENYDLTLMDMEAGLEHLSRRTDRDVDVMIIVTDPSVMGFQTAKRIKELAEEVHIEFKEIYLVGNRCGPEVEAMLEEEARKLGIGFAGRIPHDDDVLRYNLAGRPLLDLPEENPALLAVKEILVKIGLSGKVFA